MIDDELTKCVNGIERYKDDVYDLIFRSYRGGEVHYIRGVPYDDLLKTVIIYINVARKGVCGVYQSTMHKSDILILTTGKKK